MLVRVAVNTKVLSTTIHKEKVSQVDYVKKEEKIAYVNDVKRKAQARNKSILMYKRAGLKQRVKAISVNYKIGNKL